MIKGMELLSGKIVNDEKLEEINKCPVCGMNGGSGALCVTHALMIKDFNWVREYVNGQEKVDSKLLYVLEASISERKSFVINDVEVDEGRLHVEEYLEKHKNLSVERERLLREILLLEKAKDVIIEMIKINNK